MRYSVRRWIVRVMLLGVLYVGLTTLYHAASFGGDEYARLFPWSEASKDAPQEKVSQTAQAHVAEAPAIDPASAPLVEEAVAAVGEPVGQSEPTVPAVEEKAIWVRVVGSRVNVRARPAPSAPRVTSYRRDTRLRVLSEQGKWLEVRHADSDSTGWMHRKFLVEVPAPLEEAATPSG